jgi:restriction endonuclease S subunit
MKMRGRKRQYIDIVLNEERLARLHNGYTIQLMVGGQMYAIGSKPADPKLAKIEELKAQLRALQQELAPKKRKFSPELLEKLRANAARARAAKAARRNNV